MMIAVLVCEHVINEEISDGYTHTKGVSCVLYNHLFQVVSSFVSEMTDCLEWNDNVVSVRYVDHFHRTGFVHHTLGSLDRTSLTSDIARSQHHAIRATRWYRDHGGLLRRIRAIFSDRRQRRIAENLELQYRRLYTPHDDWSSMVHGVLSYKILNKILEYIFFRDVLLLIK